MQIPADRKILLPPSFEYLPGLFLRDPFRSHLEKALKSVKDVEMGADGCTAPEVAARVRSRGWTSPLVLVGPRDRIGGRILQEALRQQGVEARIEAMGPIEKGEAGSGSGEPGAPRVLNLPPSAGDLEPLENLDSFFRAGRVVLHFEEEPCLTSPAPDGAAWVRFYRLEDPAWREMLERIVVKWMPEKLSLLQCAVHFFHQGIDPLEEMYAGNNLADRNPELVANILP